MEICYSIPYSIEMYEDGSKLGAGVAIYVDQVLKKQFKYKLQNGCSNN